MTRRPDLTAPRVLLVDDHPSFRRGARALLAAEGFAVVGEAEHGAAALALAQDLEPDLVLLDIQLPDIDGFEVASRLLDRRPGLAIVFVEGAADGAAARLGALEKPRDLSPESGAGEPVGEVALHAREVGAAGAVADVTVGPH